MTVRPADRLVTSARRVKRRADDHFLTLVAAGVAFYAFLALVPTIVVAMTLYGMVADPADIEQRIGDQAGGVPDEVRALLVAQIRATANGGSATRTITVVAGLVIALWTASAGMNGLIRGIDIAHGRSPRRFVEQRGLSLGLTLAALLLLVMIALLVVAVPPLLGASGAADAVRWIVDTLRWPVVALLMTGALAALYRIVGGGHGTVRLVPGPVVGALLWLVGSAGFSFYTANLASYSRTYGSLAGIAVVLLWLYLGAAAVLVGAEVDADGDDAAVRQHPRGSGATA